MLLIQGILIIVLLLTFLKTRKNEFSFFSKLNKKEHPLLFLYPMSSYLFKYINKYIPKSYSNKKEQILSYLYLYESKEESKRIYYYKYISTLLIVFFAFLGISTLSAFDQYIKLDSGVIKQIERPKEGEGEKKIELSYQLENQMHDDISLEISEKRILGDELEIYFDECFEYAKRVFVKDNLSLNEITSDVMLLESIPNSNMQITWEFDLPEYIKMDGTLQNETVPKEGVDVSVTLSLSYFDDRRHYLFNIHICEKNRSKEELFYKELSNTIHTLEKDKEDGVITLPSEINNQKVVFYRKEENRALKILFFGIVILTIVVLLKEEEINRKKREREEQMLLDYPEVISKFTLLLNAGMTSIAAFERIGSDYLRNKKGSEYSNKKIRKEHHLNKNRYAYEEIVLMNKKIALGTMESTAIESFGRRCNLLCYLRFSTILVQNMKKGTKGMVALLELESKDAYENRKELIKQLGEKAGTKLLGPMMGMLMIVLLVIMVPALLSFGI